MPHPNVVAKRMIAIIFRLAINAMTAHIIVAIIKIEGNIVSKIVPHTTPIRIGSKGIDDNDIRIVCD